MKTTQQTITINRGYEIGTLSLTTKKGVTEATLRADNGSTIHVTTFNRMDDTNWWKPEGEQRLVKSTDRINCATDTFLNNHRMILAAVEGSHYSENVKAILRDYVTAYFWLRI